MNVQETVNPQEQAQKIWDQLDAEDGGKPQAAAEQPYDQEPQPEAQATPEQTEAPAEKADAQPQGEEPVQGDSALLDKIAGLETMLSQVTQRLRNAEGHIGGLGSQLKQQLAAAQGVTQKGGEAPTATEIRQAQSNPEAMAKLKEDYPEFANAMESALNERIGALEQQLRSQQQPQQPPGVTAEEIQRLRSEMSVELRHPGWQETVRTPEFIGWMQRQPREVQMLAASDSPQDAVRLLDLHKQATNAVTSQRTQRLSSAAAIPSGRASSAVRQKAVEDMTPQEYWRYLDELDRQKA